MCFYSPLPGPCPPGAARRADNLDPDNSSPPLSPTKDDNSADPQPADLGPPGTPFPPLLPVVDRWASSQALSLSRVSPNWRPAK